MRADEDLPGGENQNAAGGENEFVDDLFADVPLKDIDDEPAVADESFEEEDGEETYGLGEAPAPPPEAPRTDHEKEQEERLAEDVRRREEEAAAEAEREKSRAARAGLRPIAAAVQFLTRVPLPAAYRDITVEELRGGVVWFPLVGTAIGLVGAAMFALLSPMLPNLLAAAVTVGGLVLLTGAFHEDAFADFADAFGGGWTKEQTLEILKDSRLGTYGVSALSLGLLTRTVAVAAIASGGLWRAAAAFVAAETCSRLAIVVAMMFLDPLERPESLARDVGRRTTIFDVQFALLLSIPAGIAAFAAAPFGSLVGLAIAGGLLIAWRSLVARRLGGVTGDCLGAVGFACGLALLVGLAARL